VDCGSYYYPSNHKCYQSEYIKPCPHEIIDYYDQQGRPIVHYDDIDGWYGCQAVDVPTAKQICCFSTEHKCAAGVPWHVLASCVGEKCEQPATIA
jgi:hypothetical protein